MKACEGICQPQQSDSLLPLQSTYCHQVHEHCASIGRTVHVVNLDPAADRFEYPVSLDVRSLVDAEAGHSRPPR